MRVRIFSGAYFSQSKGAIELPALPRLGETILAGAPGGSVFYRVERVLHVEGADPIAFVVVTESGGFGGLDVSETGLAPTAARAPFEDAQPPLGLDW